jgi:drug/metabolite transporter (DMT)-like permease
MATRQRSYLLAGILFTLLGAVLFSAKAVLAKVIYREDQSIAVVSVLALRMLFSLPFYLGMFFLGLRGFKGKMKVTATKATNAKTIILQSLVVGALGYYVSSFLDFTGLKYITAGLERIILFTYPTFTLLFAALFFKSKISSYQVAALLISYIGVGCAFAGDIFSGHSGNISLGSMFIFGCAITYALYVLLSGHLIQKMGASFFTSVAMISATSGVLIHFLFSGVGIESLKHLSLHIYLLTFLMAFFTTVLPSYLLSEGLKRIGSSHVAIISSIGPMATILQAYWFLGESFGWLQLLGTVLVVVGVLIIGRKVQKAGARNT